jgi:hypothetical protein
LYCSNKEDESTYSDIESEKLIILLLLIIVSDEKFFGKPTVECYTPGNKSTENLTRICEVIQNFHLNLEANGFHFEHGSSWEVVDKMTVSNLMDPQISHKEKYNNYRGRSRLHKHPLPNFIFLVYEAILTQFGNDE